MRFFQEWLARLRSVCEEELECLLSMLYTALWRDTIKYPSRLRVYLYCTQFNLNLLFLLLKYRIRSKAIRRINCIGYIYDWCGGGEGGHYNRLAQFQLTTYW